MHASRPPENAFRCDLWERSARLLASSQTLIQNHLHACHACDGDERARLRSAAARQLESPSRPRRAISASPAPATSSSLTQSAVSRQILALEEHLERSALSPPAPRARADRGRRDASTPRRSRRSSRLDRATRATPPQRARADRRRHDDAGLRRPLADSAAGRASSPTHPEVDVRISASNALVNLERDGVDLGIRYTPVRTAGRRRRSACSARPSPRSAARACCAPPHPPLKQPGRPRHAHAAAHGARRRQPAAGLGPCGCAR